MKLLVIGAEGQLARSLLAAPKPAHVHVVAAGRPRLDLTRRDTVEAVIGAEIPDVVVNSAAYTAVDQAEGDPAAATAVNAEGTSVLAEACQSVRVPLIHISTDYVFDGRKDVPYVESDAAAPINVYGRTKLQGEEHVARACERHLILRTSWLFSPYGHNFAKTMLRLAGTRSEIAVVDDQLGCPTYAPHLADAIMALALQLDSEKSPTDLWGTYHAVGRGDTTWCGLAREIFAASAILGGPSAAVTPILTADYPTPARRPQNSRLDATKLAARCGVVLPDWRLGVHDCVGLLLGSTTRLSVRERG